MKTNEMHVISVKANIYLYSLFHYSDVHLPIFTGDCHPGYHGYRCQEICTYPRFGLRCEAKCKCRQKLCHYVNGCPPLSNNVPDFM